MMLRAASDDRQNMGLDRSLSVDELLAWSSWQHLQGCWRGIAIPALPGLYRIRRVGRVVLDYLGQTGAGGMTLRKRLAMLHGIYANEMPYRDPHTAAPALWALRHSTNCDFEVSTVPIVGDTSWRKGLEALAISLYRQEHGRSPTVNFGRMPTGYTMSSGNNARLARAGKRFRGGSSAGDGQSHLPGIPPLGPLTTAPTRLDWCGHSWSDWIPINAAVTELPRTALGLYRIRAADHSLLLYIGQGVIRDRLVAHLRKFGDPDDVQGRIFNSAGALESSFVINNDWLYYQRLELENDLIASHLLVAGRVPPAQFLG
jgi:hypothetical protein